MKVGLILFIPKAYGGAQRRLGKVFNEINNNGLFEVEFLLIGDKSNIDYFVVNNLSDKNRVLIVSFNNRFSLAFRLLTEKYEWVCFYDCGFHLLPSLLIAKLTKTKTLMTVASYFLAYKINLNYKDKILLRLFCEIVSHIDTLYPMSINNFGSSKAKISVTPLPYIDVNKFYPIKKENIIFFASRLENFKNPILLLESINRIKKDIVKMCYKVIIAGEGPLYDKLNQIISQYNLGEIVNLVGYIESSEVVNKSKIFISIQSFENYPSQSLLEAIASGNFIIASNVGSTKSIVSNEFGMLIELELDSLTNSILYSIRKSELEMSNVIINSVNFMTNFSKLSSSVDYFYNILSKIQ
jgi:glycosyltransferase involved in cell wall biosynthesis